MGQQTKKEKEKEKDLEFFCSSLLLAIHQMYELNCNRESKEATTNKKETTRKRKTKRDTNIHELYTPNFI